MKRLLSALTAGAVMVAGSLLANPAPAFAASWKFRYTEHQNGPSYTYQIGVNETTWGDDLGSVTVSSNTSNEDQIRNIRVCDNENDDWEVRLRIYPLSGSYIDYVDRVGGSCYTRNLGYSISHFRMMFRGTLSDPLDAPPG
ncbi:hypothetical protein [Paractinoplanes lichenicola]|uniref:Uncharacterized protein n=1 Tax=Paractinoplanes lichenicola TaxID=2802976 RepID=A0ABS1VPK3_9ACTN|nr:hypothetical protein [Actinoplanes lichenicola]MBL7255687.1 hypothetical protein [Actinoplanes lichenicola]